ncbi:MAG: EAL domain-containing protein [Burkholderiaceae bacterium]|nr:EAL domain-containing protein [Burkholderiaceae bacterium]
MDLSHLDRLRAAAEARAPRTPTAAASKHSKADLVHELRVHQVELEMQNDELRQTQQALLAARDRYVDLYDFAPVGYFTLSADGQITEANLTGASLLRQERARLVGSRFARHVAPADQDRWYRHERTLLQGGELARIELALLDRNGCIFHAQVDCVVGAGAEQTLRVTLTDISDRKRVEAELSLASTAFEAEGGIMITDAKGAILRVNTAFTTMTGYSAAKAVGQPARLLNSGRHDAAFFANMWDCLHQTGAWEGEIWNRRKNDEVYPQWLAIAAVRDGELEVTRYVGTMLDISKGKAHEKEMSLLAFYDPLTGLPNWRLMQDRLQQAMATSARSGREGALMFIDLDNFKRINDTIGHAKGDLLLRQVAQRLTACVRECDTVARPGGDEFVVILASDLSGVPVEAAAQAINVSEKIRVTLNETYEIAGQPCVSSASIGIKLFSGHSVPAEELLRHADEAMYTAKNAGRNALHFFDPALNGSLQTRTTLEADLRRASERGEFVLYYQPEVDNDRRLLGAEALLRWQRPRKGLMLPDEFIGIAEETGVIHELGRWVMETACTQLVAWSTDPDMDHLHLSVNISAHQLRDKGFVQQVLDVLDRSTADPTRLKLELTEGVMLNNVDDSIAKMSALKARGVGFSLDDFGTGYASLAYLKRLPLNRLKIDRSFVHEVLANARDAAVAHTIVELGRNLGLTVIAEGVETQAQHELLHSYGCHAFQGNLFGAPAPLGALQQMARCSVDVS